MTPAQTKLLHIAARQVGLNDRQYRMVLQNVAGVASSTSLTNTQFEQVMAVMEDRGFRQFCQSETYWRDKSARHGSRTNERQVQLLRELAAKQPYPLGALVRKFSHGRTDQVEDLQPREAWALTEMLKKVVNRKGENDEAEAPGDPSPGPIGNGNGNRNGTCTANTSDAGKPSSPLPAHAAAGVAQESLFDTTPVSPSGTRRFIDGLPSLPDTQPAPRRSRSPRAGFRKQTSPVEAELSRPVTDDEVPF